MATKDVNDDSQRKLLQKLAEYYKILSSKKMIMDFVGNGDEAQQYMVDGPISIYPADFHEKLKKLYSLSSMVGTEKFINAYNDIFNIVDKMKEKCRRALDVIKKENVPGFFDTDILPLFAVNKEILLKTIQRYYGLSLKTVKVKDNFSAETENGQTTYYLSDVQILSKDKIIDKIKEPLTVKDLYRHSLCGELVVVCDVNKHKENSLVAKLKAKRAIEDNELFQITKLYDAPLNFTFVYNYIVNKDFLINKTYYCTALERYMLGLDNVLVQANLIYDEAPARKEAEIKKKEEQLSVQRKALLKQKNTMQLIKSIHEKNRRVK